MSASLDGTSIVVMVEDPGALNFLAPLIGMFIDHNLPLVLFGVGFGARKLIQGGYQVIQPPSKREAEKTLRACGCRLLIIGTSEDRYTPAFDLILAARSAGIQSVGVVDAPVNAHFRFCGSSDMPLAYVPDWLIVPDQLTATAFDQLGFPRKRIAIVGNPARDLARQRAQSLRFCVDEDSKGRSVNNYRIVFVSELSDGIERGQYSKSNDYTLIGRGISSARTAIVAEELLDARSVLRDCHCINVVLILRLHPKQLKSDLGELCDEFDEISIDGDPLEVVASADLVIGMTSMLLLQAHDMGMQCLSILPREHEKSWLPELASGTIPSVTDRASLRATLYDIFKYRMEPPIAQDTPEIKSDAVANMKRFFVDVLGVEAG